MNAPVKQATGTAVAAPQTQPSPPKDRKLIEVMAAQYNMEPVQFAAAVKKTAMPANATNEEFAAFMMVAHEYKLNPFLRELYAFPKKGGGIVPMVSIDGWVNIINSNPLLSGFEIENHFDGNKLAACTCRMYRKDRAMPVVVTEYMIECFRNTEPWRQMPSRMLRHKALIQAARYCFGLTGIYDEDEARDIGGMRDVSGVKDITPPRPQAKDFVIPAKQDFAADDTQQTTDAHDPDTGEVEGEGPASDSEEGEFGAFEAREEGKKARDANKPLASVPPNIEQLGLGEAFQDGWRDRDGEIAENAKAMKRAKEGE